MASPTPLLHDDEDHDEDDVMTFIMVKRELVSTHDSHFAGGKHAFICMAETLARQGASNSLGCAVLCYALCCAGYYAGLFYAVIPRVSCQIIIIHNVPLYPPSLYTLRA